ncbi:Acetylcholinesterase [Colletotrichum fructicola]|nr:Acetylcholinesterase [Colletotrichum fructicola]KAF4923731.1 Acetylcholinesterase [Colletotrichum fructicola]
MPPACPQIKDTTYPFFQYVPETLPLGSFSEDCLTLNICTPSNATASSNLPVIIWIYGGAFVQGSLDTPAWNPAPWVQTSQQFQQCVPIAKLESILLCRSVVSVESN